VYKKRFAITRSRDDFTLDVPVCQRNKVEIIGGTALVQGITKEIEATFGKYEDENPSIGSVFEEILGSKKDQQKIEGEKRSMLLKEFDKLFHKTGLSKLKQIIEQTNILLESKFFDILYI
jgi:hypothetical protein